MILSKNILIKKPTGSYFKYYKDLGYDVYLPEILVKIEHLSLGSKSLVEVECYYCKKSKLLSYNSYNKTTKNNKLNYSCKDCGSKKQKELCLEKYGVVNCSQLDEVKEKIRQTNLEKYGLNSYTQTDEFKEKTKKTSLEKYGVDSYSKTNECKEKTKNTNLNKYGCEYYMETDEFKEKTKNTNLEKYGTEWSSQSEEVKIKKKNINLDKYGFEYYSQSDEFKEKYKQTCLEKYSVNHYSQSDEFKEKIKNTSLEKYGVDSYSKTDECKLKVKTTSLDKYGVMNYTQTNECKEKTKNTNLEKYGVTSYTQTDEYKEKTKNTNLEKYGTECISQSFLYREKFKIVNNENYLKYLNDSRHLFSCDKHKDHTFEINSDNFFKRIDSNIPLCTVCNPIGEQRSIKEKELFEYVVSIYIGEVICSYRDGLEIDVYLPELKLGFEFNGLYWHCEKFKDKNYHLDKTNYFKERDIRILHIWEDEWDLKSNIIKSKILYFINKSMKIQARKCFLKEVERDISRRFLEENHVQGSYKNIIKSVGLYYENELVSIMTFDHSEGRKKMKDDEWNLSRFCNRLNLSVVGGASKLLSFFVNNNNCKRIVSYADKDWSQGNLYEVLGFEKLYETKPDYKYLSNSKRAHKSNFRKKKGEVKTESELMLEKKIYKIYDCGKIKYELLY